MTEASKSQQGFTGKTNIEGDVASRLYDIGLALTSDLDLSQVLLRVLNSALGVVNADIASIHTYSAELDRLGQDPFKRVVTIGASKPAEHYSPPRPDGQTYRIAREREPIWSNYARQDPVFRDSPFTQNERVDSVAGIPLVKGDETVGVLYFNYHTLDQITEDRLRTMRLFANQAAVAITNARLFEELRQRERTIRGLLAVGERIRASIGEGLQAVLHEIVSGVCQITNADCSVLYPYDMSRQMFYDVSNVASYGILYGQFKLTDKPRLRGGMAAFVRQHGTVIINDIEREDPAMLSSSFIAREGIKAFMGVSLVADGAEAGVLYVNYRQPHFFDKDERDAIQILANQAAVAIQNARQFRALQEAQEQRLAAERWATLGTAAANLVHRINNTAALVPVTVQDLKELLIGLEIAGERRALIDDDLGRIERNTRYTLELADILLKPFKGGPTEPLDVNLLLDEAMALSVIPNTVNLHLILSSRLPLVTTSPLLVDVFVELISNAIKAMPEGGQLEIGSAVVDEEQVEVWFTDTGVGISDAHQERIFDLFFTTREENLGFGLWWVKTFLLQQGGTIGVKSKMGRGTRFAVRLSAHKSEPALTPTEAEREVEQ